MMTLHGEPLLTLSVLGRRVPGRGSENRISPRSLSRWIMRGASMGKGERVYLEAIRSPGGWLTSEAALVRFFDSLAAKSMPNSRKTPRTPAARTHASEAADAELKRLGA